MGGTPDYRGYEVSARAHLLPSLRSLIRWFVHVGSSLEKKNELALVASWKTHLEEIVPQSACASVCRLALSRP